jgi:hypothetical protein
MTTTAEIKKEQYATCECCERYCYTGGEHDEEEEYLCEDCDEECGSEVSEESEEFNVDARDAPNIFPYKKCSVCGRRGSCGLYREGIWFCENCDEEDDEDLAYDCEVCGQHLYITEVPKCEERELCARCCVGRQEDCDCPVCEDNNKEEKEPTFDDLLGDDRLDFSNPTNVAQFTAFVQANFTREEIFPETKPIITSDSISGEVSRELETLQAQNARLVAENQRLQQQLVAIKSLLSSN